MSFRTIEFFAAGTPVAQPRVRARAVPGKGGGKARAHMYTPGSADEWKAAVRDTADLFAPAVALDGALHLTLIFHIPRPKNHYGTGRNAAVLRADAPKKHTGKPDVDNLAKAVMDALLGVWGDDCQVDRLYVAKDWCAPDSGGCFITIDPSPIEEESSK